MIIVLPNTVMDPGAMVIHLGHAIFADLAMVCAWELIRRAVAFEAPFVIATMAVSIQASSLGFGEDGHAIVVEYSADQGIRESTQCC